MLRFPEPEPWPKSPPNAGETIEFDVHHGAVQRAPTAYQLATRFVAWLASHPHLRGRAIRADQIEIQLYPNLFEALGWPLVPYRDFARELGKLMFKRRSKKTVDGVAERWTAYLVPNPAAIVVDLAEHKRA